MQLAILLYINIAGYHTEGEAMAAKYEAKYMLIRWIGEENLNIVVVGKDKVGDPPFVGKIDFKWAGKFYEGKVLALSGMANLDSYMHANI